MATTHIVLHPHFLVSDKLTNRDGELIFYDETVYWSETDEPNLRIFGDIMSPATRLAKIPAKFVKYVTYKGTIYAGFRYDGIYRVGKAVLRAEMANGRAAGERHQIVSIRAPGIKSARQIYDQFRQGVLEPDKKWSGQPSAI